MASFSEILSQVKRSIREVSVDETLARSKGAAARPILIDVRERDEYEQGFVPRAEWIPRGFLEMKIEDLVPERGREVILYCAGGNRSALAARSLEELGYTNVSSMAGGFRAWKQAGHAFDRPRTLTAEQIKRYSRHIMLPEVGEVGQGKLLDAKVLCLGAGGLGSPSACTWRRPGSARSAWSTTTWSTRATCSARSSTTSSGSACRRSRARA
jgi:rhodanese-related sulfurtransferase